jgi:deazaflavin-dependent oxidoreductase (nitroreductase family)
MLIAAERYKRANRWRSGRAQKRDDPSVLPGHLGDDDFCSLSTTGRTTGRVHTIEIWFAADGGTIYLLSGGGERSDWVRNLVADPHVRVRIRDHEWPGSARVVTEPAERKAAAELVFSKYQPRYAGDLTTWRERALPVAIVLSAPGR